MFRKNLLPLLQGRRQIELWSAVTVQSFSHFRTSMRLRARAKSVHCVMSIREACSQHSTIYNRQNKWGCSQLNVRPILATGTQLPPCCIFTSFLVFGYIDAFNKPASYSINNLLQLYKFKTYSGFSTWTPTIQRLFQNNTQIFSKARMCW
jgi:hypothetical protein